MNKYLGKWQRILSLILSIMILMSACVIPVSAAYTEVLPTPETGVVFFDDFEGYSSKVDAIDKHPYYSGSMGEWPVRRNGNNVWVTQMDGGYASLWYYHDKPGTTTMNSGQLLIQMKIELAGGYEGTSTYGTNEIFPSVYICHWDSLQNKNTVWSTIANTSDEDFDKGGAFSTTGSYYITKGDLSKSAATTFSITNTHDVAILLDYERGKTYIYFDGVRCAEQAGAVSFDPGDALGIVADRVSDAEYPYSSGRTKRPYIYIDNLRMERVADNVTATASYLGNQQVEVRFSSLMKECLGGVSPSQLFAKTLNGSKTIAVSDFALSSTNEKLTLTLAEEPVAGNSYVLDLGDKLFVKTANNLEGFLSSTGGIPFTVSKDSNILFSQNFDAATFPTASAQNVDWLNVEASAGTGNNYSNMADWTFRPQSNESTYVSATIAGGSQALCFGLPMPYTAPGSAQSLIFPFGKNISDGVITVEFDAGFAASYEGTRFAFGLGAEGSVANYNPWQSWGDAYYFGGLGAFSGTNRALLANAQDKAHMLPDRYLYYGTSGSDPMSGAGVSHEAEVSQNYYVPTDAGALPAMKTWKYVIDLEQDTYSFYLNGVHQKTLPYIPGDGNHFDSFMATIVSPATVSPYGNATDVAKLYLDNVKVVHEYETPALQSICLTDYTDKDIMLANNMTDVTTGILQARLIFNMPMDLTSAKQKVSISGTTGAPAYTMSVSGNVVTLHFPNGLAADTRYTIATGRIQSASGHEILVPQTLRFTTGAGMNTSFGPYIKVDGRVISSLSSIGPDSVVSADVTFFNTAKAAVNKATLFLGAYREGCLIGVAKASGDISAGVCKLEASTAKEANSFYGADQLRVFLLNDNLTPLMDTVDFPGDYAAASFTAYDSSNNPTDKTAIASARMGAGSAPVVAQKASRSGWTLLPETQENAYISVDLDNSFTEGLDTHDTVKLQIDYYNDSNGGFAVLYKDRAGETQGVYQQLTPTGQWRQMEVVLEDASFANDMPDYNGKGFDFIITSSDSSLTNTRKRIMGTSFDNIVIGAVRVYKEKTISPFDITVETGRPGNVFVDGSYDDAMEFAVSYIDPRGEYISGTAIYTVKDYHGSTMWTKTQQFTNSRDTLSIPRSELPLYGVYTLEIEVSGQNNILQHKLVDFSASRLGVSNTHYGTNLHYDWAIYTEEELKAQIDLVKSSGIGITRSKIVWDVVDPEDDGIYKMDPGVWYANEYLDSIGLENLVILAQTHRNYRYNRNGSLYWLLPDATAQQRYANYAAWVASDAQLGQFTDYFSIMNEYNLMGPNTWHPYDNFYCAHQPESYKEYVAAMKAAVPKIRKSNPSAVIVAGEIGRYEDEWLNFAYSEGMDQYSDVLSYHFYEYNTGPEYYIDQLVTYQDGTGNTWRAVSPWSTTVAIYKDVIERSDSDDQVWLTETGLPGRADNIVGTVGNLPSTVSEVAEWLPRYYALLGVNLDKIFNYAFTDNNTDYFYNENNFGMIRAHDYRTPFAAKPAYITVSAFNHFVSGAKPVAPKILNDTGDRRKSGFVIQYPADSRRQNYPDGMVMVWKGEKADVTLTTKILIPGAKTLSIYDMNGNYVGDMANDGSFTLQKTPSYIVKKN